MVFPCVQPKMQYAILSHAKLQRPSVTALLALQGLQAKELNAFKFAGVVAKEPILMQDFAGNAFCANIVVVLIVASLVAAGTGLS